MRFPTTLSLEEFIEIQISALNRKITNGNGLQYSLYCDTSFCDYAIMDTKGSINSIEFPEDSHHEYTVEYTLTGAEGVHVQEMRKRLGEMEQMIKYTTALQKELNELGGWTPYTD